MKHTNLLISFLISSCIFNDSLAESHQYLATCSDSERHQRCPETYFYSEDREESIDLVKGWNPISENTDLAAFYMLLGLQKPDYCWEIKDDDCYSLARKGLDTPDSLGNSIDFQSEYGELIHFIQPLSSSSYSLFCKKQLAIGISALVVTGTLTSACINCNLNYLLFLFAVPIAYAWYYREEHREITQRKYEKYF